MKKILQSGNIKSAVDRLDSSECQESVVGQCFAFQQLCGDGKYIEPPRCAHGLP
jgi:hypothetical protein